MRWLPLSAALASAALLSLSACDDDTTSQIGNSLTRGEVTVTIDSTAFDLKGRCVEHSVFDTRATSNLLGRIDVPEYGSLRCSFVSRLMPADALAIPDSISEAKIDSMMMVLRVPRGALTGDSLAPQQLTAYRLTEDLPAGIASNFNPEGYYDPSQPMGSASYTLSIIAKGDSLFKKQKYIDIKIPLGRQAAVDVYHAYKENPELFQWPSTFSQKMKGIYVEPSFGNGCIANIAKVYFNIYWNRLQSKYVAASDGVDAKYETYVVRDSTCVFSTAPEVLNSNNVTYVPSDALRSLVASGANIVTTPGGYNCTITFPIKEVLKKYYADSYNLSVVNGLSLSIPAAPVSNGFGIETVPYLLMVKTDEMDEFFASNKVPDNISSFYATYDSDNGEYHFSSMRNYLIELIQSGRTTDEITEDECRFTLVPVFLNIESETNPYTGVVTKYVTRCTPYIVNPTMTRLFTERAMVCFTYSQQLFTE